jgi:hypothetical protein
MLLDPRHLEPHDSPIATPMPLQHAPHQREAIVGDTNGTSLRPDSRRWLRLLVEELRAAAGLDDPPPRSPVTPNGALPPCPEESKNPAAPE